MNNTELSALFDIDVDANLDEIGNADPKTVKDESIQPFSDRCADVKSIMEPEPEPETESVLETESAPETESTGNNGEVVSGPSREDAEAPQSYASRLEDKPSESLQPKACDYTDENPLGLQDEDLQAFHDIRKKYPHFKLYDGSRAFHGYYVRKVQSLKTVLARHPCLPIDSMKSELRSVELDHSLGDTYCTPDLLRKKIDDAIRNRVRVSTLLMEAEGQYPLWHRTLELIQGKLYLDHDIKPAHRRDGLNSEHLLDVENYVAELKSFIKVATHADDMLKAADTALSRQLSCVQIKEPTGFSSKYDEQYSAQRQPDPQPQETQQETQQAQQTHKDKTLDEYDVVEDGEVISAPNRGGTVSAADFGSADNHDDISVLGIE